MFYRILWQYDTKYVQVKTNIVLFATQSDSLYNWL